MIRKSILISILAAIAIAASASAAPAQDVANGEHSFGKCAPCHSIGPELDGLDGRHSGTAPNFNYSDANKNSGIVWNEATFKGYIKSPQAMIPGTKMTFAGIKNEQEINDVWDYIKQFDANGDIKK